MEQPPVDTDAEGEPPDERQVDALPRSLDSMHLDDARPDDAGNDDDLPVPEHHELPPAYQPDDLPTYAAAITPHTPPLVYHLRQMDKKQQLLTPFCEPHGFSYKIPFRRRALFSKKPEMTLLRTRTNGPFHTEQRVAEMSFWNDGPLPWMPRARVAYLHPDREPGWNRELHPMEARNFANWRLDLGGGQILVWTQEDEPVSLVLSRLTPRGRVGDTLGRFAYSQYGNKAENGAVIGELSIGEDACDLSLKDRERVIAGFVLVIEYWRRTGRYYRNPEAWGTWVGISRRDSVLTEEVSSASSVSMSRPPTNVTL